MSLQLPAYGLGKGAHRYVQRIFMENTLFDRNVLIKHTVQIFFQITGEYLTAFTAEKPSDPMTYRAYLI
ncbi:MAG: hypothetical protein J6I96_04935 [Oscillospiraceae bacterium]|nr:hypothetical protein [Oscillospiraceae bacterium]